MHLHECVSSYILWEASSYCNHLSTLITHTIHSRVTRCVIIHMLIVTLVPPWIYMKSVKSKCSTFWQLCFYLPGYFLTDFLTWLDWFLTVWCFGIESHMFGLEIKFRIDWYKTVLPKIYSSRESLFTETLLFRFLSDFRPFLLWWKHWHKLWLIPEYVYKLCRFLSNGAWFIDDLA